MANMASAKECTDGTDLVEKLKKLASVPPIYIDKALKYTINGCGIDCEVTASSAFGAATKFAIWEGSLWFRREHIKANKPRSGRRGK